MVIWPDVVTKPWIVEFSMCCAGPSASCALLLPVKAPLVAVPSDHKV
jgi:hypothetical protein